MLDWNKPLQTRSGYKATKLHEYYNGVQQMAVVSLEQRSWNTGGTPVEIIKVYDMRWGKLDGRSSMTPANEWDLIETPPEDIVQYVVYAQHFQHKDEVVATTYDKPQLLDSTSVKYYGQTKIVIDPVTLKVKSTEVVK